MNFFKRFFLFICCAFACVPSVAAQHDSPIVSPLTKAVVAGAMLGAAGYAVSEYVLHRLRDPHARATAETAVAPDVSRAHWQRLQRWCQRLIIASLCVGGGVLAVRWARGGAQSEERLQPQRQLTREEFAQLLAAAPYCAVGMTEEEAALHGPKVGAELDAQLLVYAKAGEVAKFVDLATYTQAKHSRIVDVRRLKRACLKSHTDRTLGFSADDKAAFEKMQKQLNAAKDSTVQLEPERMIALYDLLYGTFERPEAGAGAGGKRA